MSNEKRLLRFHNKQQITLSAIECCKNRKDMIVVIAFIVNLLAPIVNTMGVIGLCGMGAYGDWGELIWCGVFFVIGLFFGIWATMNDVPARWFWSRSVNELFNFFVFSVLGYAWSFAMWPAAIYLIRCLVAAVG